MERNREVVRRGSMSRRRHRITTPRDSSYRDREVLNENKRRRIERCNRGEDEDDGGDVGSTDESFNNNNEDAEEEDDERRIPRNRPSPSSSSISSHSQHRNTTPARGFVRSPTTLRITDEMVIGVPVPRKARSGSSKRSHEVQGRWKNTTSPGAGGLSGASRSSSDGSLKRKKMQSAGIKTRLRVSSRSTKSSSSTQEDIEIEVAEALFDLMTQSKAQSNSKSGGSVKQERSSDVNKVADDRSICSPVNIVENKDESGKGVRNRKEAVSFPNDLISEMEALDDEGVAKIGMGRCLTKSESMTSETLMGETLESKKEGIKKGKDLNEGSVDGDSVAANENLVTPKEESSPPCAAVNAIGFSSFETHFHAKDCEKKRETKFEIDLMASPPMPSSPVKDLIGTGSDYHQLMVREVEMKDEMGKKKEEKRVGKGQGEKKIETSYSKADSSKFEMKMPSLENVHTRDHPEDEKKPNQCQTPLSAENVDTRDLPGNEKKPNQRHAAISAVQNFAKLSWVPFSVAGAGWPTKLPHPGYALPVQIAKPVDGSAGSVTALQPPPFSLSKPCPKRCAYHQYIACNIRLHQQLIKKPLPVTASGSATTIVGAKTDNCKPLPLSSSEISGNANKSCGAASHADAANSRQLMLQQGPQHVATANILHGQALVFQLGQQHASLVPSNQCGPPKSASAHGNPCTPCDLPGRTPVSTSPYSAGTGVMSFNHQSLPSNASPPCMGILPNSGYPFPFSTNFAGSSPNKGRQEAPAVPFFNGSYIPSPVFPLSQRQPKQDSQPQVQTSQSNTSTSNGFPPFHPSSQPLMGPQVSGNMLFPPISMFLQQPSAPADGLSSLAKKSNNTEDLVGPVQPISLAYMTSGMLGGSMGPTSSNCSEQRNQRGKSGGVQLMPHQGYELSFSSLASTTASLNFPSKAQNSALFHMLPDMGCPVYKIAPGTQMGQHQKNLPKSDGNIMAGSILINNDEEKKSILATSPGQSLNGSKSVCTKPSTSSLTGTGVFDSFGRAVSFVQLPVSESQTSSLVSTLPMTIVPSDTSSLQQQHHQQLLNLQKQHQQMQMTGTAQPKEQNPTAFPLSFITTNPPNNPVFSQTLVQTSSPVQSPKLKYVTGSQVPSKFNTSNPKGIGEQKIKNEPRHTHLVFDSPSSMYAASQGRAFVINHQSAATLVGGSSPSCSILNDTSANSKTAVTSCKSGLAGAPPVPSQQIETSRSTLSQKSSPVCGRNMPSILNSLPSQLPELKY